jgi:hypothetical protein
MPSKISLLPLAAAAALLLAGCERGAEEPAPPGAGAAPASDELAWARDALRRNPNLEILATDTATGVFTVRERSSGEVQTVKVSELAAAPIEMLAGGGPSEAAPPEPPAAQDDGAAPEYAIADAGPGEGEAGEAGAEPQLDYTVERSGGQVRVTGPGVSIVSAGTATPAAPAAAGERKVDPIICEGPRMLQLNDRRISVEGDAIIARGGCELHITNSRVSATGTGLVVRDATVVVTNSEITGTAASFDAGAGAKLILQGATLKGTARRDEGAQIQELGNNRWQ